MADETGRPIGSELRVYVTCDDVDIRVTMRDLAPMKGMTAGEFVKHFLQDFPLLRPGKTWRFMTGAEILDYEAAREADAA